MDIFPSGALPTNFEVLMMLLMGSPVTGDKALTIKALTKTTERKITARCILDVTWVKESCKREEILPGKAQLEL